MPGAAPLDGGEDHGWPTADGIEPWLPFPPEADHRNYDSQRGDEPSILHLYRRLLALRRKTPALCAGSFELLDTPEGVLGYRRRSGDDAWVVLVNFTDQVIDATTDDGAGTADLTRWRRPSVERRRRRRRRLRRPAGRRSGGGGPALRSD